MLAALQHLRDTGIPLPRAAALLSPLVDSRAVSPSWRRNRGVDWGDAALVLKCNRMYAGKLPLDDPRVSPILGKLCGLPRLLVMAGDSELLVDDAAALADAARAEGVDVDLQIAPDMVHAYMTLIGTTPRADEALTAIARFFEDRIGKGDPARQ